MRRKVAAQLPIVHPEIDHEHAKELQTMSAILDRDPTIYDPVHVDLLSGGIDPGRGREGMTAEQVTRVGILKQMNGFSYDELAFHIADSRTYRAFCRLGIADRPPKRGTLQRNLKLVSAEAWEAINRRLVQQAAEDGVERGRMVRVDCTVTASNIHEPTDSSLLWDCVRVLARVMARGRDDFGVVFTDHRRRAKRRNLNVQQAKTKKQRTKLYRDLLKVTHRTVGYADRAAAALEDHEDDDPVAALKAQGLAMELREYIPLARQVIDQTERRVLHGESVPSSEKLVSIFETHTDIIVKDRRDTLFGHKLCLASGKSGLITDCEIEEGNPADSKLAKKMIERQVDLYARPPRQAAYDGGFASKMNLRDIKVLGVKDVVFHKKRGLEITDMAKSAWVYKKLRNFRAGIEGMISFLKRCFGLGRCTWRGFSSFKAYTWASIVSSNLLLLARHALA